jgi:hypothetical protein
MVTAARWPASSLPASNHAPQPMAQKTDLVFEVVVIDGHSSVEQVAR